MALIRFALRLLVVTLVAGMLPAQTPSPKRSLILLLSQYSHQERDLAAATLGWMAKANGAEFEAYYATDRADGGIFSAHGSSLLGGRHELAVARAMAKYDTTVIRLGDTSVFTALAAKGARRNIKAGNALSAAMEVANQFHWPFPKTAVAIQTAGLPKDIEDVHPYLFPEIVHRQALALPLESTSSDIDRLKARGVTKVLTIASKGAVPETWKRQGLATQPAEEFAAGDTLFSITFRIAKRWVAQSRGIDLCEPVMAAHWLPFSVREGRLQMCSRPTTKEAIDGIVELAADWPDPVVYGRWGGGSVKGVGDFGLFPFFRKHLSVEVSEPGRPVLTIFSKDPDPLPQPAQSPFDLEPSDTQLRTWAKEGRILATYMLHSGELSHDDGVIPFVESSGTRRIPIGMGVHWQRYAFEPWSLESIQIPHDEGGALGYVEPVLHSTGHGIMAEREGDPKTVAAQMKSARERIAAIAGARFAPRGVYCFLDADTKDWISPAPELWKAIRDAGFEYVISSVASGGNRVLYRDGKFVVLNLVGKPGKASPFVRHFNVEMPELEQKLRDAGKPGWLVGVLDTPVYSYSPYLSAGHKWGLFVRVSEFYDYIEKGAKERNLIPAMPHTIARYAGILAEMGLISQ